MLLDVILLEYDLLRYIVFYASLVRVSDFWLPAKIVDAKIDTTCTLDLHLKRNSQQVAITSNIN